MSDDEEFEPIQISISREAFDQIMVELLAEPKVNKKLVDLFKRSTPASSPAEQNDETEREAAIAEVIQWFEDYAPGNGKSVMEAREHFGSSPAATTREWGVEYTFATGGTHVTWMRDEDSARRHIENPPLWAQKMIDPHVVARDVTPAGPWSPVPKEGETP